MDADEILTVLATRGQATQEKPWVMDLKQSEGPYFYDLVSKRKILDFAGQYGSLALGYRHPKMMDRAFGEELLEAARLKPANLEYVSEPLARFVETFHRVAGIPTFEKSFFVDGGTLGVENALKAAFDWKARKAGLDPSEAGRMSVIGLRECFHGRSGYTLSLTDSHDPNKTLHFPRLDWKLIPNPKIHFPQDEAEGKRLDQEETLALDECEKNLRNTDRPVAAILLEPIQAEGGDHHFRPSFFEGLRSLADRYEALLIYDEVQTGMGTTGRMWSFGHFGVAPDLLCFGKKLQVAGFMAGPRLDEVQNVFRVPSRISSTFGGGLVDMVRARRILEIIEEDGLVGNAARQGDRLLQGLRVLESQGLLSQARGRGLFAAFDLAQPTLRDRALEALKRMGLACLSVGIRGLRFRPPLDTPPAAVDEALGMIEGALKP